MNSDLTHNRPPTSQVGPKDGEVSEHESTWLKRAQDAYRDSTSYVDSNLRKQWDDSIRAFNNQHASDSKYNHPSYEKRSKLYRPKIRSIIRKNEAAAAAAFFSNMDVVSIEPTDQSNKTEVAAGEVMKQILQYRLTKSIPWYQVVIGGLQDAQTNGVVCAHIYWDYQTKQKLEEAEIAVAPIDTTDSEYPQQMQLPGGAGVAVSPDQMVMGVNGDPFAPPGQDEYKDYGSKDLAVEIKAVIAEKPVVDKPCVDLFPIENLRIDANANWMDPVNSSPYVIQLIPMYAGDVREKMNSGEWRQLSDGLMRQSADMTVDSTRQARHKDREDPASGDNKSVPDYETVWIQRHIHREAMEDWEFYTLGDLALLTEPRPLRETVFHGKRPYVIGNCIIETHKAFPSSLPILGKGLIDEANEVVNQRIDNVKFVLNKKFFAKRGQEVDVSGLIRNVPGGVVMMNNPDTDVREITWPDVTQSAYEEQNRIDNDMADLLGNFSPAQVMADHGINAPARNMAMLNQSAGTLVEYLLRTYVETFVQPVLRQLVLLIQEYETDETVLGIAAKKANLFQRFGIDQVTDELLSKELTLTVNVGMGATDPQMKLQKFIAAVSSYANVSKMGAPGLNMEEVAKEIFGHLGYSDGSRFLTQDNPQVIMLQQQLQQANQMVQQLNARLQEKMTDHQLKARAKEIDAQTKIQTTQIHEDNENLRNATTHLRAIAEENQRRQHEAMLKGIDVRHDVAKELSKPASNVAPFPMSRAA